MFAQMFDVRVNPQASLCRFALSSTLSMEKARGAQPTVFAQLPAWHHTDENKISHLLRETFLAW